MGHRGHERPTLINLVVLVLETGSTVTQSHWKWHLSTDRIQLPINVQ